MKKRICLLTSEESFLNNYGAALQGYALFETLCEMGFDVSIVRYDGYAPPRKYGLLKDIVKRIIRYKGNQPSEDEIKAVERKRNNRIRYKREIEHRELLFRSFQDENMSFYSEKRMCWETLRETPPISDIYMCGSDQIWNPNFHGGVCDPGYFLTFAPKESTKIAYAPSFGCDDIPKSMQKMLFKMLKDFKAISVREKSGVDIVKKYGKRKAEHVLDPTLLRTGDEWRKIAKKPEGLPKHYILCYRFAESNKTKSMIDQISQNTGWQVVSLPLSEVAMNDDYCTIFEAGPQEFVGLIEHASLVCTDSFHATVFSILMNTPVCVFLRESYKNGNSMNSRIYSILQLLKLEHHIIKPDAEVDEAIKCIDEDYKEANEILATEREKSFNFLIKALQTE